MSARHTQDQKGVEGETFVPQLAHTDEGVSLNTRQADAIVSGNGIRDHSFESTARKNFYVDTLSSLVSRVDAATLIRLLRRFDIIAKQHEPRIAFKAKGRILFVSLGEIVAVQAEGNYVSLRHRNTPYLLRESISSMAEKLKPYGFIRIHRSVVVNISAVEEIQPLPTGEYRLRVRGGMEFLVTRTYKGNLRDLAQLWVGSEHICSE